MSNFKFNLLIKIGLLMAYLAEEGKNLCLNCHQKYSLFKIANASGVWLDDIDCNNHKNEMLAMMKSEIKKINKDIRLYNNSVIKVNPNLKLATIKYSNLDKEITPFFKKPDNLTDETNEKLLPYLINSFDSYVSKKILHLIDGLSFNSRIMSLNIKSFELDSINEQYRSKMYEVIDLYLMGYKSTSLLVLGRIFEEIITKYLLKLNEEKNITLTEEDIYSMRFENKLGFLKANHFISEKDWLVISKLKFDRNIGGHFVDSASKLEAETESEATIKLAMKLINKFNEKLQI